jgi:hypothetical protein
MVERGASMLKSGVRRPTMAYVDQISLPMRIALAAALAFAALWFVALRPKPVDVGTPVPATAQPAPEVKADKSTPAKADAAKSEPKSRKVEAEPAAKPAAKLTGAKAVLADVQAGRTVVLLFYHPSAASADDQAVRRAVKGVDRHDGKVRVYSASLGKIGQYEAITKAATIQSTPTVLVIDRKAQVRSIEGLTVTREIDALVDRALKVK